MEGSLPVGGRPLASDARRAADRAPWPNLMPMVLQPLVGRPAMLAGPLCGGLRVDQEVSQLCRPELCCTNFKVSTCPLLPAGMPTPAATGSERCQIGGMALGHMLYKGQSSTKVRRQLVPGHYRVVYLVVKLSAYTSLAPAWQTWSDVRGPSIVQRPKVATYTAF